MPLTAISGHLDAAPNASITYEIQICVSFATSSLRQIDHPGECWRGSRVLGQLSHFSDQIRDLQLIEKRIAVQVDEAETTRARKVLGRQRSGELVPGISYAAERFSVLVLPFEINAHRSLVCMTMVGDE